MHSPSDFGQSPAPDAAVLYVFAPRCLLAHPQHRPRHRWLRKEGSMLGCSHNCTGQKHKWVAEGAAKVMRLKCIADKQAARGSRVEHSIANGIMQKHACVVAVPVWL